MATLEAPVLNRLRLWLVHTELTPDAELVQRFVAGRDESAFAALVDRHGPMVLGVARRVVGDHHAAEDVFQAAFLMLARRAAGIRRPDAIAVWLHQAAHRLSLTAVRARGRRERIERSAPPVTRGDPLAELSARELVSVLDDELQRLPDRLRQVLVLCCLEGRSQEETAAMLGMSPGAVRGRLERGRRRLRERLARRGLTFSVAAGTPLLFGPPAAIGGSLREATLQAASGTATPSSAVVTLVESGVRSLPVVGRPIVIAGIVGIVSAGALGIFLWQAPPRDPAPPARAEGRPAPGRTDDFPLPADAAARLAWDPLRIGHAQAALTPDGTKVIALAEGAIAYTFDAATGKLLHRRPLGDRRELSPESRDALLSADGSVAAVEDGYHSYHCTAWNLITGERLLERPGNSRTRSL